ncbi:MAG: 16S rRNA (cytosine(967)-C(5))-methyltransferase RsmB [Candidatus Electrothrix sp. YB6]
MQQQKKESPKSPSSRSLAMQTLVQWAGSGKPVQGVINRIIHDSCLNNEDRQLAVMLVMGVLRGQEYLDIVISRFSKTKLGKMKPLTLVALRIGVLQLCCLERIPDSAAVNETVKALKKMRQPGWLCSFVNGTLRNIARNREKIPEPECAGPQNTPVLNHPAWLTERWQKHFSEEKMRAICQVNSLEPELCLQINPARTTREQIAALFAEQEITTTPGRYAPDSLLVHGQRGAVTNLSGFADGLFQVQDQAARLACSLLGPLKPQGRYLDGCAGLGGKTCALAALLPEEASLYAVEPEQRRFRLLQENLQRQQLDKQITVIQQELQAFTAAEDRIEDRLFDGILIDAPCSGTGVIRRHPDIRWNRLSEDFTGYQEKQLALLRTAAALVKPGGVLVYATCSLEPEENQQVVEQFLAAADAFELTDCRAFLPDSAAFLVNADGFFAPLPTEEIEGFFAARLERKSNMI